MTPRARNSSLAGTIACFLFAIIGCGSDVDAAECGVERSAIVFGAETSTRLSNDQADAIVRLRLGTDADSEFCSGVMITPTWLLSAAHCSIGLPAFVDFGADANQPRHSARTDFSTLHPELDLSLWRVVRDTEFDTEFEPLRAWAGAIDASLIGVAAELAGYGATEDDSSGKRLFVSEQISEVDSTYITVDGAGRSGACSGDSGGPLLVTTSTGEHAIAGILSTGSTDCRGIDLYVRLDRAWEWLSSQVPEVRSSTDSLTTTCH
jgi:hypothetical protein